MIRRWLPLVAGFGAVATPVTALMLFVSGGTWPLVGESAHPSATTGSHDVLTVVVTARPVPPVAGTTPATNTRTLALLAKPSARTSQGVVYRVSDFFRATKGAGKLPRLAGGAPMGSVRSNQIHGLDEALSYARRNGGRIRRDATPFRDEKGLLPPGSYQEWTVRTPGVAGRGSRRLVYDRESGRGFYSWNHYDDFVEVAP